MSPTCAVAPAVTAMDIAVAAASADAADDARRVRLAARFFLRALALSAVLHAATLVWLPGPRHAVMRAAMPLMATLRLLPAAPPADSAATAPMPGLVPTHAARRPAPTHSAPAPAATTPAIAPTDSGQATAAAAPAAAPAAAAPAAAAPVATAPVATAPVAAAPIAAAPVAAVPAAAASAAAAPDAAAARAADESLTAENYGRDLSSLLSRQRPYPRLAAQRGWQGEVRLRVHVARKGAIVAVQLLRSSGFAVLDQDAVQLVQQADPLPNPPPLLQDREFQIIVPIFYKLAKSA